MTQAPTARPAAPEAADKKQFITRIAGEMSLRPAQVTAAAELLSQDCTVPFIARYRKEATGSLDEVQITQIRDRLEQLTELEKRRAAILKSLEERSLLTAELRGKVEAAAALPELEDIYLPYRPKRRTRATMAAEKGLTPLADALEKRGAEKPAALAAAFVNAEKGVKDAEEALAGARDILAERFSENAEIRAEMRDFFQKSGEIASAVVKGQEESGIKFRDYFDWKEPVGKATSHRILAMLRAENEGVVKLNIRPPELEAKNLLYRRVLRPGEDGVNADTAAGQVRLAADDGYGRLLAPAMETEVRAALKAQADTEAIAVFVANVRELLMAAPLGQKTILALDPGFRTGCKLVVLNAQGKLLHDTVIYPTQSENKIREAEQTVRTLCAKFGVQAVAIGNGTAGRETENFVRGLKIPNVTVVMVNESGASVYSASETARAEFPDKDVTVRGAVSIGRRLADPLAELVKIDPKAIGVGQYQHDVNQAALKRSLDDTVASCVNAVGVEVNTASVQLLSYVSGLGPKLAESIVKYRDENGAFTARAELKKVPRLGAKAFEQCAGFLRIRDGADPLDASAVHPERYNLVKQMAKDTNHTVEDLMHSAEARAAIDLKNYITDDTGMPTLNDIMAELAKPGRDPREKFEAFAFAENVHKPEDLAPGMKLPGIVTNVTKFGAFVDIGVHQDGLVHVSQLADSFVSDPAAVVKVQQKVTVTVLEVDLARQRISLSMRTDAAQAGEKPAKTDGRAPNRGGALHGGAPRGGRQNPGARAEKPQAANWLSMALKGK